MRTAITWITKFTALALAIFTHASSLHAEERTASVILQVPSVNVQQTFTYGERRGFFKHEGIDLRIVVIRPHLATATLLSDDTQFTAPFQTAFYAGLRGAYRLAKVGKP
jgi:ABC-type nitrate/sulfonate/bicarbonate transport system substrate-binding protein